MKLLVILLSALTMNNNDQLNEDKFLLSSSIMKTDYQWRIVNDAVMGGLSSSRVIINEENKIVFSGNISLKNNGGFASLRSPVKNYNFEDYSGIEINVKGDGKIYSISMKETTYFTGYFFTASFQSAPNKWHTIKIPFDRFAQYYFGKKVEVKPTVPLSKIKEISFLIGNNQEDEFSCEIDYIKLYRLEVE